MMKKVILLVMVLVVLSGCAGKAVVSDPVQYHVSCYQMGKVIWERDLSKVVVNGTTVWVDPKNGDVLEPPENKTTIECIYVEKDATPPDEKQYTRDA